MHERNNEWALPLVWVAGLLALLFGLVGTNRADDTLAGSLRQSLERQGWQASRDAEGNTLYTRPEGSTPNARDVLKKALEAKGWRVEWDEQHNLILYPSASLAESVTGDGGEMSVEPPEASVPGSAVSKTALAESLAQSLEQQGWQPHTDAEGNRIYTRAEPSAPAQASENEALKQALEARGWRVEWDEDRNMILYPPAPAVAPAADVDEEPAGSQAASASGSAASKTALAENLAQSLQRQGWHESTDAAGNRIFTRGEARLDSGESARRRALKQALEARGWRVDWDDSGSMILRPPSNEPPGALVLPATCEGVVYRPDNLQLPVDSPGEAKAVADAWVEASGLNKQATSGRIRKVLRVYLVSIVARQPPHRLLHQLAVRVADGRVILLH